MEWFFAFIAISCWGLYMYKLGQDESINDINYLRRKLKMAISRARAEEDGMLGGGCPELKNLDKIEWEQLEDAEITIEKVVTTTDADGNKLYAITTEEYPKHFMWCGASLTKYIEKYGDDFIGTKFHVGSKVKTKSGRYCRNFDIIDN